MGMCGYELESNDMFADVKAAFKECMENNRTKSEATAELLDAFSEPAEDEDDAFFVYAALADGQMENGGILKRTQKKCLELLELQLQALDNGEYEIEDEEEYRKMLLSFRALVEAGKGKKKPRVKPLYTTWKIHDVYATQLKTEEAAGLGIAGRWALMWTVGYLQFSPKEKTPYVYLLLSPDDKCPTTREEIERCIWLRFSYYKEYRVELVSKSQEMFDEQGYIYIGNWEGFKTPEGEYIRGKGDGLIPPEHSSPPIEGDIVESAISVYVKQFEHRICRSYAIYQLGFSPREYPRFR